MNFAEMLTLLQAKPTLLYTMIAVFALCIGSFMNVVIYRVPKMLDGNSALTLATPRSHCPHCASTIPWNTNIPIISYVVLRGTTSCCRQPISPRYPIVEMLTLVLTLICVGYFGLNQQGLAASVLCWGLIALLFIDLEHLLLPDDITQPLIWLGLSVNLFTTFTSLEAAVIGAIVGYLTLWTIGWLFKYYRGIDGIGHGDYKLLAAIGAWLGYLALPQVILLSSAIGVIYCLIMMLLKKQRYNDKIAFGPFLVIGAIFTLFLGNVLWSW